MTKRQRKIFLGFFLSFMVFSGNWISSEAVAGGYEKSLLWSGHYSGVGGAASSLVTDSESLYYNPAGLAAIRGIHASANFSPTFSQFSGPITTPGQSVDSDRSFSPLGAAFFGTHPVENWGFGIGAYVGGGAKAIFNNVDFSSKNAGFATLTPPVKSDLSITEISAGAGYEILDGLRFGAAYRVVMVNASLASASLAPAPPAAPTTLTSVELNNLSATKYNGFRLGVQYSPYDAGWGVGASFRSELNFTATGTSSGRIVTAAGGTPGTLQGGDVSVTNTFPLQASLGAHYDLKSKANRILAQYDFSQYSKNQTLAISGNVKLPQALGGSTSSLSSISQNWMDMHNVRLGFEHFGNGEKDEIVYRGGYVFTSAVAPKENALATFTSPGPAHTFVVGAGAHPLSPYLVFNLALEYSVASGTVTTEQALNGTYSANAFAAHLGIEYTL